MDSTSSLSDRTLLILIALGCAGFGVYMTYFMARASAPAWVYVLIWCTAAFFGLLAARAMLPDAEERAARAMASSETAVTAPARITATRHMGLAETGKIRQTYLEISAELEQPDGSLRPIQLTARIEDALLPNFASGQTLYILYEPAQPERVAIDRRRSPVRIK